MAGSLSVDFQNIIKNINNGEISSFYFLVGEEEYFIDKLIDFLEENIIDEESKDFNQYVFYGADTDLDTVLATCRQFPVGSPRQLVILKELQTMKGNSLENLELYLRNPVKSTVLAISFKGEIPKSMIKFLKNHEKNYIIFKSTIRSYEIDKYVRDYCNFKKINIDDKSIALLIEYIGNSLKKISNEIDRLEISENKKIDKITPDLIERYIGISKDYNNFELTAALVAKDYLKCLKIVSYFRANSNKNRPEIIIPVIFGLFQRIAIAQSLPSKSDQDLNSAIGNMSFPALKELKVALATYSLNKAVKAIDLIREYDAKTKGIGSSQNAYDLIQELIFKIITL